MDGGSSPYRLRKDATFMWSIPNRAHETFRYEISDNGVSLGRSSVQLRSHDPRIDVKLQGFGEFALIARSCDGDDVEDCSGWSILVPVTIGPAIETPEPEGMLSVKGTLVERWHELGAWSGHLGKPTVPDSVSVDGTRSETFEHGMISTAPAFPGMVVAAYQRGRRLEVNWRGSNTAFNGFRVDVFHNGVKLLEALVHNSSLNAHWARMAISPAQYSFATWKGDKSAAPRLAAGQGGDPWNRFSPILLPQSRTRP